MLVENHQFEPTPPHELYLAPPEGVTPLKFRRDFWYRKL